MVTRKSIEEAATIYVVKRFFLPLKSSMERDLQSLLDMLQSAQIATGYIARRSRQDLETDLQLQDAIIRRLLIICEAARRISEETQQSLPTVPWSAINGMRNLLVHEYDEIDLDIV